MKEVEGISLQEEGGLGMYQVLQTRKGSSAEGQKIAVPFKEARPSSNFFCGKQKRRGRDRAYWGGPSLGGEEWRGVLCDDAGARGGEKRGRGKSGGVGGFMGSSRIGTWPVIAKVKLQRVRSDVERHKRT